jgi:hypothetical protein
MTWLSVPPDTILRPRSVSDAASGAGIVDDLLA